MNIGLHEPPRVVPGCARVKFPESVFFFFFQCMSSRLIIGNLGEHEWYGCTAASFLFTLQTSLIPSWACYAAVDFTSACRHWVLFLFCSRKWWGKRTRRPGADFALFIDIAIHYHPWRFPNDRNVHAAPFVRLPHTVASPQQDHAMSYVISNHKKCSEYSSKVVKDIGGSL